MLSAGLRSIVAVAAVSFFIGAEVPTAHARDLFSALFDALSGRTPPPDYGRSDGMQFPPRQLPSQSSRSSGRSTAYCVRTCDGRYFPLSASSEESRAAACSSLCPASETRIFYGSTIEGATTESGKPYTSLENAFKYREQLVSGCTCNGTSPVGLASVAIEDDKTIRKGDIVAGPEGLIVATRGADGKRGRVADFSPAPSRIREKFERSHAMMRD